MKHPLKITLILLAMFLITQFIGLYVVNYYAPEDKQLPLGMEPPQEADTNCEINSTSDFFKCTQQLYTFIIAFIIAVIIIFLLTKFDVAFILKAWFFLVVAIALTISFNSFFTFENSLIILMGVAILLSFIKVYKQSFLVHNATELLTYPGIAAVFVPILNMWSMVILLILLSIYDIWAVWKSGIMVKMAKYQMNKLKILGGFLIPSVSEKVKAQIKKMKKSELKKKKIRINLAILGGGDIIFPIIAAGVVLKTFGFASSLFVTGGATLALVYLFFLAKKRKHYPAMPYLTTGIFAGIILSKIVLT